VERLYSLVPSSPGSPPALPARRGWADLHARVFAVDVPACPHGNKPMNLRCVVTHNPATTRILRGLRAPRAPPRPRPDRRPSRLVRGWAGTSPSARPRVTRDPANSPPPRLTPPPTDHRSPRRPSAPATRPAGPPGTPSCRLSPTVREKRTTARATPMTGPVSSIRRRGLLALDAFPYIGNPWCRTRRSARALALAEQAPSRGRRLLPSQRAPSFSIAGRSSLQRRRSRGDRPRRGRSRPQAGSPRLSTRPSGSVPPASRQRHASCSHAWHTGFSPGGFHDHAGAALGSLSRSLSVSAAAC
jgi:hypothetical protein